MRSKRKPAARHPARRDGKKPVRIEQEAGHDDDVERALRREVRRRLGAERVIRKQAAALTRTRQLLLREPALPDFIRALLRNITRECGGVWTTLWKMDERSSSATREAFFWIDSSTRDAVEEFAAAHPVAMRRLARIYEELLEEHRCTIVLDATDRRVPAVIRKFYRTVGVGVAVVTPSMPGSRLLGWISHLSAEAPSLLHQDKVAFIEATAQQATLAIHLARLGDSARAAKEAREREIRLAEQEQEAREITRLLHVGLGEMDDPAGDIMHAALGNVASLLHGSWGMLWKSDRDADLSIPVWAGVPGSIARIEEAAALHAACAFRARHSRLLRRWLRSEESLAEPCRGRAGVRLLEDLGGPGREVASLAIVPLRFDGEVFGFIVVATDAPPGQGSPRSVAAQALAMQAALALRLEAFSKIERSAILARERERIARDLHDLLAQSFSGIALQIEAMRSECRDLPTPVLQRLEKIREQAERSMEDMRRTLQMLGPAALDRQSFAEALRELASGATPRPGWTVTFANTARDGDVPSNVEIHLFAIASEALQNALAHSKPGTVTLALGRESGSLFLRIESAGEFEDEPLDGRRRFGLANMRARAATIGGRLSIASRNGRTIVELRLPLSIQSI